MHIGYRWLLAWHQPLLSADRYFLLISVLEKCLNPDKLRSRAVATFMPIHSYLFNSTGQLLYANSRAMTKIDKAGGPMPSIDH